MPKNGKRCDVGSFDSYTCPPIEDIPTKNAVKFMRDMVARMIVNAARDIWFIRSGDTDDYEQTDLLPSSTSKSRPLCDRPSIPVSQLTDDVIESMYEAELFFTSKAFVEWCYLIDIDGQDIEPRRIYERVMVERDRRVAENKGYAMALRRYLRRYKGSKLRVRRPYVVRDHHGRRTICRLHPTEVYAFTRLPDGSTREVRMPLSDVPNHARKLTDELHEFVGV